MVKAKCRKQTDHTFRNEASGFQQALLFVEFITRAPEISAKSLGRRNFFALALSKSFSFVVAGMGVDVTKRQ